MSSPINIYVGWDRQETVAYHVFAHSIIERSSEPVAITPLNRKNLKGQYFRRRGEKDSTDFSNTRWIVPHLQNFDGWAIFADCDMLCLTDIAHLWNQRDDNYAVMVKKHNHTPKEQTKFLGREQTVYARKNWSSLILMNCSRLRMLTKHIVNTHSSPLWFHTFDFLPDEEVGEIEGHWNHLVGYNAYEEDAKLVHFTVLPPWFNEEGLHIDYSDLWLREYNDMIEGDNPVKWHETARAFSTDGAVQDNGG